MNTPNKNEEMLKILGVLAATIEQTYGSKNYAIMIGIHTPKDELVQMYELGKECKPNDFARIACGCIYGVFHNNNGCPKEN